jgi:hypothetical protein
MVRGTHLNSSEWPKIMDRLEISKTLESVAQPYYLFACKLHALKKKLWSCQVLRLMVPTHSLDEWQMALMMSNTSLFSMI